MTLTTYEIRPLADKFLIFRHGVWIGTRATYALAEAFVFSAHDAYRAGWAGLAA
jgi:hypothetical protein